jgi:hypothetical protein
MRRIFGAAILSGSAQSPVPAKSYPDFRANLVQKIAIIIRIKWYLRLKFQNLSGICTLPLGDFRGSCLTTVFKTGCGLSRFFLFAEYFFFLQLTDLLYAPKLKYTKFKNVF